MHFSRKWFALITKDFPRAFHQSNVKFFGFCFVFTKYRILRDSDSLGLGRSTFRKHPYDADICPYFQRYRFVRAFPSAYFRDNSLREGQVECSHNVFSVITARYCVGRWSAYLNDNVESHSSCYKEECFQRSQKLWYIAWNRLL